MVSNSSFKLKLTGVGSLPHQLTSKAIEYSLRHDLPFVPQLPHAEGFMIQQEKNFAQSPFTAYLSLEDFLNQINRPFKFQISGPMTSQKNFNEYLPTLQKIDSLFSKFKDKIIIFLDEPIIEEANLLQSNLALNYLKERNYKTGVHSCHQFEVNSFALDKLDFLSFDEQYFTPILVEKILDTFTIPIVGTKDPSSSQIIKYLSETNKNFFVSSTCGLALESESHCEEIYRKLRA